MKKRINIKLVRLAMVMVVFLCMAAPALAAEMTLIGEVNDNYQLVSDGQVYEIADTAKGNEMAENFISTKVKVTGLVEEQNEIKTITVVNFEVMPE